MQSPFSFRRFAPAFDYLGSPFSAFFRPLLLGFRSTLSCFPTSFFPLGLRFLSFAFSALLVTQRPVLPFSFLSGFPHSGSPVLIGFFRPLCLSPSVQPDFSCFPSGSAYSAFLYCFLSSFPASLPQPFGRCSSKLSLKMFLLDIRFLSSASVLGFQLLSFCFFISSFPLFLPHSWPSSASRSAFAFRSSSFLQPGFPCFLSDSEYFAFCLFPFVLPCFAPTAVPQVLPF